MKTESLKIIDRVLYGIDVVIFNEKLEILMLHRNVPAEKYKTGWEYVKGALRERETFIDAALREIFEETGLKVEFIDELSNIFEIDCRYRKNDHYDFVKKKAYVFKVPKSSDCKIILDKIEHDNFNWMPIEEALENIWVENGKEIILEAFELVQERNGGIIRILGGEKGCKEAKGVAVVIDVFRATSTLCCLLKSNPKILNLAKNKEDLKEYINENFTSFSEIDPINSQNDNSPLSALSVQPNNSLALASRNGTKAFNLVKHCEKILAASFLNIDSVVRYLKKNKFSEITLIPIGNINKDEITAEDLLCANMIKNKLLNKEIDEGLVRKQLHELILERKSDPDAPQGHFVDIDLALCTSIGIFNVLPEIKIKNGKIYVTDLLNK